MKTNHPVGNIKIKLIKTCKTLISNIILFFLSLIMNIKRQNSEIIISTAFYAPWKDDEEFKLFFKRVCHLTLLDTKRAYTLWYFSKSLKDINASILEVGCLEGGAGFTMSKANRAGNTYLIDTFSGFESEESFHKKDHFVFKEISEVKQNIKYLNLKKTHVVKAIFPKNLNRSLRSKKIKLWHIDVNVYKATKESFEFVEKRLIKGGIIIFDDYGIYGVDSVKKFISKISKTRKNKFTFVYNFMGQCILIKK